MCFARAGVPVPDELAAANKEAAAQVIRLYMLCIYTHTHTNKAAAAQVIYGCCYIWLLLYITAAIYDCCYI